MELKNVVLVDGVRSPFSRGGKGKFEATRMDEVAVKILRTLMDRNPKVKDTMVDDIGIGNAANQEDVAYLGYLARLAGFPVEVSNFHSNRHCASSMETLHRIAMAIMVGSMECGISLGIERMTRSLMGAFAEGPPPNRTTEFNQKLKESTPLQRDLAHDHYDYFSTAIPDGILDSPPFQPMVQTAQNVVDMYGLSREELDAFAVESHLKGDAAYKAGHYKDEVIPLEVEDPIFNEKGEWVEGARGETILFERDECIRGNSNKETLAGMNPIKGIVSFCDGEVKITPGNSCPTNSGVSAALIMSESLALKLGLEPLARIVGMGVAGVKQQITGMGPVPATKKALKHAGLDASQIDRVEFNEAFAAQVIPSLKELGISQDIVNVNGGSMGIGHPIGATGARLVMTVAKELRRSGKRYGLAPQCIGAGQGMSTIVEAL